MGGDHLWEAIGAIGEMLGALGVAGSLLFVGVQLLHNTRALRLNGTSYLLEQMANKLEAQASDENISALMFKGMPNPESLEGLDYHRFTLWAQSLVLYFANVFFQYRSGALDKEAWESICSQLTNTMNSPGMLDYWTKRGGNFPLAFREFMDTEVIGSGSETWRIAGTEQVQDSNASSAVE
jgi:hypothetical protein